LKKKIAKPVAQSKESLAKAKAAKRASQANGAVLAAGLVGVLLAEEGYAVTPSKSNDDAKGAKKSGTKKTADTQSKDTNPNPNAEQAKKEAPDGNSSRVVVSGDAAEINELLSTKPTVNEGTAVEGSKKTNEAEGTQGDGSSSAANAPANNPSEIVFPAPPSTAAQIPRLLQDEQTWLEQSLAKTSKGLGGIFFSEAPNKAAVVDVLQAENQWVNETVAKTAQGQGAIEFPSLSTAGSSSIAAMLNQESRQVDLANANAKPSGNIDFAQNLGDAKQSMANLFAGESISVAGGAGKGEVSDPNVTVQVADVKPSLPGGDSDISMADIGLGLLGLALGAAGGGGASGQSAAVSSRRLPAGFAHSARRLGRYG
jgi:hypothetical protein